MSKKTLEQDYSDLNRGMQQSKCCALPLGDSPFYFLKNFGNHLSQNQKLIIYQNPKRM